MKVFRPPLLLGCIFFFAGLPFALVGYGGVALGWFLGKAWGDWDGYYFFWVFGSFGALFSMLGAAALAYRIEIDPDGIARLSWFGLVCYRDYWTSLKSWTTGKIDDKEIQDRFFVEFDFAGRPWPYRIEASMVAHPGFDDFVAEVRSYAASKEKPASEAMVART